MSEIITDLVQQGLTAARVGDMDEARRLLTQATEAMPHNIEAWLGLAGVLEPLDEKKECLAKVLALDPDHKEAQAGLVLVEQKLADQNSESIAVNTGLGFCYRHPQTETGLRCNRCDKFICPKCAKRTPVGFRCPNCIREQEDKYYSGGNLDYVIAIAITLPLSFIAAMLFSTLLGRMGFFGWLIGFFVAPMIGGGIAESVRWAVRKRRSRYLRYVVIVCLVLAVFPYVLLMLLSGDLFRLIAPGMLIFLGGATISTRLR